MKDSLNDLTEYYKERCNSLRTQFYALSIESLSGVVLELSPRKGLRNLFYNMSGRRNHKYNIAREVFERRLRDEIIREINKE